MKWGEMGRVLMDFDRETEKLFNFQNKEIRNNV